MGGIDTNIGRIMKSPTPGSTSTRRLEPILPTTMASFGVFCHLVNCSYTGLVGLGLRFRVRHVRNPVYPNIRLYKTYCELFLRD